MTSRGVSMPSKWPMRFHGIAASVKIVEPPGLPPKGDVSDWLDAGGSAEALLAMVAEARSGRRAKRRQKKQRPFRRTKPNYPSGDRKRGLTPRTRCDSSDVSGPTCAIAGRATAG